MIILDIIIFFYENEQKGAFYHECFLKKTRIQCKRVIITRIEKRRPHL